MKILQKIKRLLTRPQKGYVSPVDRFLFVLDQNLPKSKSQLAEIKKFKRIAKLRDGA